MRSGLFLAALLLPLCSAAPAPFEGKHKHDGNDTRNEKIFENSQIGMGDLTVDTATGDNMQIGHTLDINVVQSHGVQSIKENADDSPGHAPPPAHSQDGDFDERLRRLFKSIDGDKDRIISVAELIRICHENDIYISEEEAKNVLTLPDETVPFTLSYFLAILENAASSSDTGDLIHFLLHSVGSLDHVMFDKNLMHVFVALDVDHDCQLFVPDILTIFQDLGSPMPLDEAKSLLSGHHGHNHHDGVDFSLWKKLILGEVFKKDDMTLIDDWRDAFVEVKKSFNTVGDVMRTNIENAAKTAVNSLKHGSELGECYKGELLKVESASIDVKEGLQYKLQLRMSTMGGEDCMESREMICENIMMTKPLPKDCKGTDSLKLINREHITCEQVQVEVEKIGFEACVDEWCLQDDTNEQYTRCEEATDGGNTCINPQIKYGSTEGAIPLEDFTDYDAWCKMIFHEERTGTASSSEWEECTAPNGYVYWCEDGGKAWCDPEIGPSDNCYSVLSLSCTPGDIKR